MSPSNTFQPATPFEDVFEKLWERIVPFPFCINSELKQRARQGWNLAIDEIAAGAGTPAAVKSLTAFYKIGQMVKESKMVLEEPNPDPEAVVSAVRMLLDRAKSQTPADEAKR